MEKTTKSSIEIETAGGYMDLSFSRAPKKNHDALTQLGKQYMQWLKNQGVKGEIYYLNSNSSTTSNEIPPEGVESVTKILPIDDEEELWVALQFYRDQAHADQVRSKMMQDESVGAIMNEFDRLVTQGKSMITDGFSRLRT
jgi:uncharacterized protein YbaA (DUF1428 family)